MLSSKKRLLWVFIVILLLGVAFVSYGYFLVSCDHNTYIKRGFSTELKDKLKEEQIRYNLYVEKYAKHLTNIGEISLSVGQIVESEMKIAEIEYK